VAVGGAGAGAVRDGRVAGHLKPLGANRIAELLERAQDVHVLVVGDLMLDRYISGRVGRISPEAPVPVVRVEKDWSGLGGAANVAANVVALGARCSVVGCVGDDAAGRELSDALRGMDMDIDIEGVLQVEGYPTTVKTRVMALRQQIVRVDREDAGDFDGEVGDQLLEAVRRRIAGCGAVAVEDYNKGVLVPQVAAGVLEIAEEAGVPTIVDPKRRRFSQYEGVTVLKPNAKELEDALGEPLQPQSRAWMEAVRAGLKCHHLLLTLGEEGMALQSEGEEPLLVPTWARSVYDVSGAGDTVTAVLAIGLAAGGTVAESAVLANHAAALVVGKAGVATVTPEEILHHAERGDP
jgi:rfaE bifunctional protein kinase chain/domain